MPIENFSDQMKKAAAEKKPIFIEGALSVRFGLIAIGAKGDIKIMEITQTETDDFVQLTEPQAISLARAIRAKLGD